MFYTLKASYGVNKGKYYLYENINDPGYLPNLYSLGVAKSSRSEISKNAQISVDTAQHEPLKLNWECM